VVEKYVKKHVFSNSNGGDAMETGQLSAKKSKKRQLPYPKAAKNGERRRRGGRLRWGRLTQGYRLTPSGLRPQHC
jgi:hypothetical protein